MTHGERMIWAAAYVYWLGKRRADTIFAVERACLAVLKLRGGFDSVREKCGRGNPATEMAAEMLFGDVS